MGGKGKAGGKGKGGGKEGKGKSKKGVEKEQATSGGSDAEEEKGWRSSAAMAEVFKGTAIRLADIDAKATQLMDALYDAGKSDAACQFLIKSLQGVSRDKVANWRAYVFTLLRGFDKETYEAMKNERGRPRPRRKDEKTTVALQSMTPLKATAPEFVPGQSWGANLSAAAQEFVPQAKETKEEGTVILKVEYTASSGESVGVIGSSKELGSFEDSGVVSMTADGALWSTSPLKVAGEDIEYKFVVIGSDKAITKREEKNRKLKAGEEPKVVKFGEE